MAYGAALLVLSAALAVSDSTGYNSCEADMMKIRWFTLGYLALVLAAIYMIPMSVTYGYSGTSNVTSASVDDSRVDPSASVTWTVGPILNGTGSPIGIGNSSLYFDGAGDYVNCSPDASLDNLEQFTYEAWYTNELIISNHLFSKLDKFVLQNNNGEIRAEVECSGTDAEVHSQTGIVTANQLTHLVVTYDNTSAHRRPYIYVNGAEVASYATEQNGTGPMDDDSARDLQIGYRTANYWNGTIDEVRVYNRTLIAAEIAEHYQGIYTNETGLVLYLDFDGQTQDHSGEGNNGIVNGDPEYSDGWANCPVSSSYNGTGGTTVGLVNSTSGLCTIPDTAPATWGNYTVTLSGNNSIADYNYTGFIVDTYLVNVYSIYETTEEDFNTLLYADGESRVDGHSLSLNDTLTIEGITFNWNTYTNRFEATDSESTPQTKQYDTLTALLEDTYGITSGSMNITTAVTWTQGTLDRVQTDFMTGDWVSAIIGEYTYTMGELFFWTTLMTIISVGAYNVWGAYPTIFIWVLGWGVFTDVIHGQAQIIGYIFILLAVGIAIVKLTLDRRTT